MLGAEAVWAVSGLADVAAAQAREMVNAERNAMVMARRRFMGESAEG